MALLLRRNEISLEVTSSGTANVPNNDVARLMYYLGCVCAAIDCNHDPEIQRFTNYHNWSSLSTGDQRALLAVCYTFSPDVFNNRVFFHSDALCGSSSNKFYRIHQVRHQLLASESIVIAGRVREVNEIMTYTMGWMRSYYFEPMEGLVQRLSTPSRTPTYGSIYTPSVVRQPITYARSSTCSIRRICCIICCVLVGIVLIIIIIAVATNQAK